MIIKVNKIEFEKYLVNISRALNVNSPLHSLQGILIKATSDCIELIASNGNLSINEKINTSFDFEVIEPGKILVPGKLFKEIIKKQEGTTTIKEIENIVEITSKGVNMKVNLFNVTDYPIINFDDFGKEFIIDVEKFKSIIKNVSFAAAEADKRIILNGVNLLASNNILSATATNSFRLAYEETKIDSDIEFNITILSKNLKDFIPFDAKGELKISVSDSKIITRYNSTTIVSKLIDGVYPEIKKLIPSEFVSTMTIDSKTIDHLIDKAIVVSNDDSKVVKMSISENELIVESKRNEVGVTSIKTHEYKIEGEEFSLPFNAQFLKDAISKFSDEIFIKFSGKQKPFIIKSNSKPRLTQLILPHRSY